MRKNTQNHRCKNPPIVDSLRNNCHHLPEIDLMEHIPHKKHRQKDRHEVTHHNIYYFLELMSPDCHNYHLISANLLIFFGTFAL